MIKYARGTVWWAELGESGGYQTQEKRLVLIISDNKFNQVKHTVTVLPITHTVDETFEDCRVVIDTSNTGDKDKDKSYVMCDQSRNIDKRLLQDFYGVAEDWEMSKVQRRLSYFLGLERKDEAY